MRISVFNRIISHRHGGSSLELLAPLLGVQLQHDVSEPELDTHLRVLPRWQNDKRFDYPGKLVATKPQFRRIQRHVVPLPRRIDITQASLSKMTDSSSSSSSAGKPAST